MTKSVLARSVLGASAALFLQLFAIQAYGAGSHGHGHGDSSGIGQPAQAEEATRTIEVVMYDNYYEPEQISVKEGETVRFAVKNAGQFVHEFNIGTSEMHVAHQPEKNVVEVL